MNVGSDQEFSMIALVRRLLDIFFAGIVKGKRLLAWFLIPASLVLVAIAFTRLDFDVKINLMTSDFFSIAHLNSFIGILSDLDCFFWAATASICYFTAATIRGRAPNSQFTFLIWSGILTTYLLFDDFFLFHDRLVEAMFGLTDDYVYAVLGPTVLLYLFIYRRTILQTNYILLFLALGFLGMSVMTDAASPWLWRLEDWEYFIEDGFKWLGIISWCMYFGNASYDFIRANTAANSNDVTPDEIAPAQVKLGA
jgi:hypothetical protein